MSWQAEGAPPNFLGPWVQKYEDGAWMLLVSTPEAQVLMDELEEMGVESLDLLYSPPLDENDGRQKMMYWVRADGFFLESDLWKLAGVGSSVARWLYLCLDQARERRR